MPDLSGPCPGKLSGSPALANVPPWKVVSVPSLAWDPPLSGAPQGGGHAGQGGWGEPPGGLKQKPGPLHQRNSFGTHGTVEKAPFAPQADGTAKKIQAFTPLIFEWSWLSRLSWPQEGGHCCAGPVPGQNHLSERGSFQTPMEILT